MKKIDQLRDHFVWISLMYSFRSKTGSKPIDSSGCGSGRDLWRKLINWEINLSGSRSSRDFWTKFTRNRFIRLGYSRCCPCGDLWRKLIYQNHLPVVLVMKPSLARRIPSLTIEYPPSGLSPSGDLVMINVELGCFPTCLLPGHWATPFKTGPFPTFIIVTEIQHSSLLLRHRL